jgi:hypothetical protein
MHEVLLLSWKTETGTHEMLKTALGNKTMGRTRLLIGFLD